VEKSESPTQEWTLASVPHGERVTVLSVLGEHRDELLVHGIRPGVVVSVDGDAPFGGPRIVRLVGSRVAIDRKLARLIVVGATGSVSVPAVSTTGNSGC
jgi:Fe2+ transport system protein FeoA